MSSKDAQSTDKKPATPQASGEGQELGGEQVQHAMDAAADKGYFGTSPDPTPRANYSVAGQVAGAPTPETDDALAAEADAKSQELGEQA
jgi:hypothetical protein